MEKSSGVTIVSPINVESKLPEYGDCTFIDGRVDWYFVIGIDGDEGCF